MAAENSKPIMNLRPHHTFDKFLPKKTAIFASVDEYMRSNGKNLNCIITIDADRTPPYSLKKAAKIRHFHDRGVGKVGAKICGNAAYIVFTAAFSCFLPSLRVVSQSYIISYPLSEKDFLDNFTE